MRSTVTAFASRHRAGIGTSQDLTNRPTGLNFFATDFHRSRPIKNLYFLPTPLNKCTQVATMGIDSITGKIACFITKLTISDGLRH